MTVLVPTDIETRGESLLRIADGWDGPGSKAPDRWTVLLVVLLLRELVAEGYPTPFLYPTEAGGVRAEWPTAKQPRDVSVDFDPAEVGVSNRRGAYHHALDMTTGDVDDGEHGWDAAEIAETLRRLLSKEESS